MFGWRNRLVLKVDVLTASETGLVRKDNQDSLFVDAAKTVFCVADGMGGGAEGGTASRFVCEEVEKAVASVTDFAARVRAVDAAIGAANARILAYAEEKRFRQMGSTLAVLLVDPKDGRRAAICHIGDSRVYRVRRGSAELLTHDHTIGGQLSALATGRQAVSLKSRANPLSHVLTRAIGVDKEVAGEWRKIDVEDGDRYLVCSDGVHDVVSDSLVGEILTVERGLEAMSKRLGSVIVRNGAPDNYTYAIVEAGGAA